MIKLISQFDNEKMRASVATPTCGPCCCCCCCCIVTAITFSAITARHFGKKPDMLYLGADTQFSSEPGQENLKNYEISIGHKFRNIYMYLFFLTLLVLSTLASWSYFRLNYVEFLIIPLIIGMFLYSIWYTKEFLKSWRKTKSAKELMLVSIISIVAVTIEFFAWLWFMSELDNFF